MKHKLCCDGILRRDFLKAGALVGAGLGLSDYLSLAKAGSVAGKAKAAIYVRLAGGPSHMDTFDMKPDATDTHRGEFKEISTNVPGIQFCELLPRTAALADKFSVCRSMATDDNIHSSSSHWVLTGYKYRGPNSRTIQPTDWPYLGSVLKQLNPSEKLPALTSVWLPDVMRLNENVTPAGQTAGFLGAQWNPELFVGDPAKPSYEIESLRKTDITPIQLLISSTI